MPDGVLFGSSNAHTEIRRKLIEDNRLDGVVSMPSGVFRPYAGVSTAVLLFTKGAATERVWFYDMEHDGFSLDDKRQRVSENDIPDVLECWQQRHDAEFAQRRTARLAELKAQVAPLQAERLRHHALIHRLKFEEVIADAGPRTSSESGVPASAGPQAAPPESSGAADSARQAREQAEAELAELQSRIAPLEREINQLCRQFWVPKDQIKANRYDLSASRYRQVEQDEVFYERPEVTLERLRALEQAAETQVAELTRLLAAARENG